MKKKVLALACDNENCGNWRIIQPYRNFTSDTISVDVCYWDWQPRYDYYDAIILQRPIGGMLDFIRLLQSQNKKVFIEVDDLFPLDDPNNPTYEMYKSGTPPTEHLLECCRISNGIFTSTPFLQEHYRQYNDAVELFYNAINFSDRMYTRPRAPQTTWQNKVVMMWSGSSGHGSNLEIIKEAVEVCLHKHPNLMLAICGSASLLDVFNGASDTQKIHIPECSFEEFKTVHSSADFVLAPLQNFKYNEGKSNIRILEPSVWSVPTIGSDIGEYKTASITASTTQEWIEAIERLYNNVIERNELGKKSREFAESSYNLKNENYKRDKFLTSVLS